MDEPDDSPLEDSLLEDSPPEELDSALELSLLEPSLLELSLLELSPLELSLLEVPSPSEEDFGDSFGLLRVPVEELLVELRWAPEPVELALLLPGKAFAATSARTPVRTMLPATSQRLMRLSLSRAASLVWVVWLRIVTGTS